MASNDRLPNELDCTNLAKEWPIWKRTFLMYMMATDKMEHTESKKIATFLWLIGSRAMDIYNTLFPNDGTTAGIIGNQNVAEAANAENADPAADDVDANAAAGAIAVNDAGNQRTLENILEAFD